jgi:hypothetical protein
MLTLLDKLGGLPLWLGGHGGICADGWWTMRRQRMCDVGVWVSGELEEEDVDDDIHR